MALGPDLAGAAGPTLDVRNNHDYSHTSDQEVKDIYAYGAGLHSTNAIVGLSDFTNLQNLSLHGNQIERIEGLEVLQQLVTLNLSSNNITWMEGLSQLKNLRVLSLSNNRIREVAGLQGLVALRTLILSHNELSLLGGLSALHGQPYALQHLDLRDNLVEYLCELWILGGCSHLEEAVFECGGYTNPVCKESGYHSTLLSVVPRLHSLDGSSCMGHAPLFNADLSSSVPSLWAIHHSYPGHQNPVNPGPKIPRPPLGDGNISGTLYTRPTKFHQDADAEGTGFILESRSCETGGYKLHDQLQKSDSRQILCHRSRGASYPYQGRGLQKTHDFHDHQMQSMATQDHESDADCARPERNSHQIIKPKYFQQEARRSVHASAENLIVNAFVEDCDVSPRKESSEQEVVFRRPEFPVLHYEAQHLEAPVFKEKFEGNDLLQGTWSMPKDKEELDNSFSGAAGTDGCSRIVRFVGQNSKSALSYRNFKDLVVNSDLIVNALKSLRCPRYLFPIVIDIPGQKSIYNQGIGNPDRFGVRAYFGSSVPVHMSGTFDPLLMLYCYVIDQANHLQPKLSTITVLIDGNCSYTDIGKQHILASLELYKKDNELLYLNREKKTLEDAFEAFKKLVVHERQDWQADEEHKSVIFKSLGLNLKGCKMELKILRKTVLQTERELIAAVKHVESSIVLEETKNLSALNSEILALKEALNSALNTCQTVGTALNDANQQKEKAKRTLVSLSADLDEQRTKVKIIAEMLVTCTHQERISRKECNRLKSELDMVCQLLRKNKDCEAGDLIEEQSPLWQARAREETEYSSQQLMVDELHRRLVITQTMVIQAIQENAKTLSTMKKLRDKMIQEMLQLEKAFEAVTEKERGAKELISELSCIVSAQKKRSEWMQHELVRRTASKEEVEHLQAEILRLQEKSNAAEQKEVKAAALKCELANVISNAQRDRRSAEEAACTQFSSLIQENNKLAARASSLVHNIQEAENIIKAKTEVCENQEVTIQQLNDELEEAKNAVRMSEADLKVLEDDLVHRLHDEVEQKCELRNELTLQETIISEMEDELKLTKSAKYAAEQACKSLQQKVNDVDSLLRHVDEEISSVKTLYEGREKTISLERDDALVKVTLMQKKLDDLERAAAAAMQAQFESTKLMETKEQKSITALIQKDILIEDIKRKVLEVEAELHSRDLALKTQKAISAAKVEQLGKVLEELREADYKMNSK